MCLGEHIFIYVCVVVIVYMCQNLNVCVKHLCGFEIFYQFPRTSLQLVRPHNHRLQLIVFTLIYSIQILPTTPYPLQPLFGNPCL